MSQETETPEVEQTSVQPEDAVDTAGPDDPFRNIVAKFDGAVSALNGRIDNLMNEFAGVRAQFKAAAQASPATPEEPKQTIRGIDDLFEWED